MLLHSLGMVCNDSVCTSLRTDDSINVVALVAQVLPLPIILVDENLSSNEKVFAAALPVSATHHFRHWCNSTDLNLPFAAIGDRSRLYR
eukprot:COSAG02_NODE_6574_length_3486_cov_2.401240_3_plen_89_part_00